jgi:hypothetical protein
MKNDYLKHSLRTGRKRVICVTNHSKVRRGKMGEKPAWERRRMRGPGESMISAISVGAVFILIGLVYVLALPSSLWDRTIGFFSSLTARQVPGIVITLPAPTNPGGHAVFYTAVFQFSLGLAFLQILVLALRIGFGSRVHRIAETTGNLVFWFGASYLVYTYLNRSTTLNTWLAFWAGILIVLGLSIIARAGVLLSKR